MIVHGDWWKAALLVAPLVAGCASAPSSDRIPPLAAEEASPGPGNLFHLRGAEPGGVRAIGLSPLLFADAARPFWCGSASARPPSDRRGRALDCVDSLEVVQLPYASIDALQAAMRDKPHELAHAVITPQGEVRFTELALDTTGAGPNPGRWRSLVVWILAGPGATTQATTASYQRLATFVGDAQRTFPRFRARLVPPDDAGFNAGIHVTARRADAPAFDVLRFCAAAAAASVPIAQCPGTAGQGVTIWTGSDAAPKRGWWRDGVFWPAIPGVAPPPGWWCVARAAPESPRCVYSETPDVPADAYESQATISDMPAFALISPPAGAVSAPQWSVDFDALDGLRSGGSSWCPRGAHISPDDNTRRGASCVDTLFVRPVDAPTFEALGPLLQRGEDQIPQLVIEPTGRMMSPNGSVFTAGALSGPKPWTSLTVWLLSGDADGAYVPPTELQYRLLASLVVTLRRMFPHLPAVAHPIAADDLPADPEAIGPGLWLAPSPGHPGAPFDWARMCGALAALGDTPDGCPSAAP
jgi:hypothetical protein